MKTTLKNMTFIAAGAILATTAGLYAASIDANINSFTQYIQELFITSDGTPDGDPVLSVDAQGIFEQHNSTSNTSILNGSPVQTQYGQIPTAGFVHESGSLQTLIGIQDITGLGGGHQASFALTDTDTNDFAYLTLGKGTFGFYGDESPRIGMRWIGSGSNNLILGEEGLVMHSNSSNTGNNTRFVNGYNEELLTINNDGSFIQTNPQTNMIIANDTQTFGFPAAGIGFQSGSVQGVVSLGTDGQLVNIDVFGGNNNIGDFAGVAIEVENNGSKSSLIRGDFSSGQPIIHGLEINNNGIFYKGNSTVSNNHSVFINETQTELLVLKNNGQLILPQVPANLDYADDTAAAAAGVPLGGLYHTSGDVKIRTQ